MQAQLSGADIHWSCLDEPQQIRAEQQWRAIYGGAFVGRPRVRQGAKAENEYFSTACTHYLIVPFTSNVQGTPVSVHRSIGLSAYECRGPLFLLHGVLDVEFFVSPMDFDWTMVHTHEDYVLGGPYFIRREWISGNDPRRTSD